MPLFKYTMWNFCSCNFCFIICSKSEKPKIFSSAMAFPVISSCSDNVTVPLFVFLYLIWQMVRGLPRAPVRIGRMFEHLGKLQNVTNLSSFCGSLYININEAFVPTNDNNKEGLVSPVYIYLPSCLLILATLQWSNEPWDQCNSQKISGTQHNMFQVSLWKWHQDKISNEARITTGCYSCPIGQPESHHRSNRELFQGVSYNCNLWTLGQLDWMIFCESRKESRKFLPLSQMVIPFHIQWQVVSKLLPNYGTRSGGGRDFYCLL